MYEQIKFDVAEHIATITLHRPEARNAFTPVMAEEIGQAIRRVDEDDEIRVAIITGHGDYFCAGADLAAQGDTFKAYTEKVPDVDNDLPRLLWKMRKPLIAAVNGSAAGVGVTLPLIADFRIMAADAKFGFVFAKRGFVPEFNAPWYLPRLIGHQRAAELMLTGKYFNGEYAKQIGLALDAPPKDQVLPRARELAAEIAQAAPLAVAMTKRMLLKYETEADPRNTEGHNLVAFFKTAIGPDATEGITAFLEKRAPEWKQSVHTDWPDDLDL